MSFYLLENENFQAEKQLNGKSGWYYTSMSKPIQGIVIHTAEGQPNAKDIAKYFAKTPRPASAHVVIDDTNIVELLPDDHTAFHSNGSDDKSLGLELAYKSEDWGKNPEYEEACIELSAEWCADKVKQYDIPIKKVTKREWDAGVRGFIGNSDIGPTKNIDPGKDFDWVLFLKKIQNRVKESNIDL